MGGDGFPVDAVWNQDGSNASEAVGGLSRQRLQVQFG